MARDKAPWITTTRGGALRLRVRVQPGASAAGIGAVDPWRGELAVRVKARAEGGAANAELRLLMAERLGVAAGNVVIARGATARGKEVEVTGVDETAARRALEGER